MIIAFSSLHNKIHKCVYLYICIYIYSCHGLRELMFSSAKSFAAADVLKGSALSVCLHLKCLRRLRCSRFASSSQNRPKNLDSSNRIWVDMWHALINWFPHSRVSSILVWFGGPAKLKVPDFGPKMKDNITEDHWTSPLRMYVNRLLGGAGRCRLRCTGSSSWLPSIGHHGHSYGRHCPFIDDIRW